MWQCLKCLFRDGAGTTSPYSVVLSLFQGSKGHTYRAASLKGVERGVSLSCRYQLQTATCSRLASDFTELQTSRPLHESFHSLYTIIVSIKFIKLY